MCYDVQVGYERRIKEGIRTGRHADDINHLIDEYNERFNPPNPMPHVFHHVSAFVHPHIGVIHLKDNALVMEPMQWGLIPFWCKDRALAHQLWNQTPNARSESMFEKPAYRDAARQRRGIIVVDSFFEHHHFAGKTYPFNISLRNGNAMLMAVIWDEWTDQTTGEVIRTFSMVTTRGNELMTAIHNSPKLNEPRMPVILQPDEANQWLFTPNSNDNHLTILPLCRPLSEGELESHTVQPLRGKASVGNRPEALKHFEYVELTLDSSLNEVLNE